MHCRVETDLREHMAREDSAIAAVEANRGAAIRQLLDRIPTDEVAEMMANESGELASRLAACSELAANFVGDDGELDFGLASVSQLAGAVGEAFIKAAIQYRLSVLGGDEMVGQIAQEIEG